MKQVAILVGLGLVFALPAQSQNKKEQDVKAIKSMCGCYEVGFNFAETFQYSEDENYTPSEVKHDTALEWIELVEDSENKIVMQHILIVGPSQSKRIVKHWRQDWLYENTALYLFDHNNSWTFVNKPKSAVKGQWTQKVFQVDDSPRYEGTATWTHVDGVSKWENTTPAPLPRREYTKRDDYNVSMRGNAHIITDFGWVHDQDNDKVIRAQGKKDVLLAQEKGYNTYVKVADEKCQMAIDWWKENKVKWALVRTKWDAVFARNKNLKLQAEVDEKPLYRHLFDDGFPVDKKAVDSLIDRFVIE